MVPANASMPSYRGSFGAQLWPLATTRAAYRSVLSAPPGTPRDIVTKMGAEVAKVLASPDVKERLDAAGFESIGNTPDQFAAYIRSEIDKWAKVVKASGVRAE